MKAKKLHSEIMNTYYKGKKIYIEEYKDNTYFLLNDIVMVGIPTKELLFDISKITNSLDCGILKAVLKDSISNRYEYADLEFFKDVEIRGKKVRIAKLKSKNYHAYIDAKTLKLFEIDVRFKILGVGKNILLYENGIPEPVGMIATLIVNEKIMEVK